MALRRLNLKLRKVHEEKEIQAVQTNAERTYLQIRTFLSDRTSEKNDGAFKC